jgi:hypothetical protein
MDERQRAIIAEIGAAIIAREHNYRAHAEEQLQDRSIGRVALEDALLEGEPEIIEDYPDAVYGPCCIVWCITRTGRALHVLVSYPPRPSIITAWWPDEQPERWSRDFKRREP